MGWLGWLLHAAMILAVAPALAGLCGQAAARWRGVGGPALDQPWHDTVRLWRKAVAVPAGASFVFGLAPVVALGSAVVAAVLVPGFATGLPGAGLADMVVVAGLLAVSWAVPGVAGWDAGSAGVVQASGAGVAARLGVVPVVLLVAMALGLLSGGTNLDAAVAAVRDGGAGARLVGALSGLALLLLAVGEGGVGGGWSGRLLGLLVWAGFVRRVAVLSLAGAVGAPFGMASAGGGVEAWGVGVACWLLKLGGLGLVLTAAGGARWPAGVVLPAAALLALLAVVVAGLQGAA